MSIKNLGTIQAIWIGTTAPSNTAMLWYDTNTGIYKHKYYDIPTSTWLYLSNTANQNNYRAGRVIFASVAAQVIAFSTALGSVDADVVITRSMQDASGDDVVPKITSITKNGYTCTPAVAGTLHYHAFLKV
jgi:hypothetical protein